MSAIRSSIDSSVSSPGCGHRAEPRRLHTAVEPLRHDTARDARVDAAANGDIDKDMREKGCLPDALFKVVERSGGGDAGSEAA